MYNIADEYSFKVIFLPPYSPDLNPIENFWANFKNYLRNYSRDFKTIQEAIMNFFKTHSYIPRCGRCGGCYQLI
ncbi:MAG: transposase [Oscillospiraceae bacterium]|nr:transposase [Oscillospiraceae bacterium]